jgi:hypothetical protein
MAADERTPLIANGNGHVVEGVQGDAPKSNKSLSSRLWNAFGVENRILFAGFLITLSFTFTQVP